MIPSVSAFAKLGKYFWATAMGLFLALSGMASLFHEGQIIFSLSSDSPFAATHGVDELLPTSVINEMRSASEITRPLVETIPGDSTAPTSRAFNTSQADRADIKEEPGRKQNWSRMIIPWPVFVLSLPKSGTSSISSYFNCGLKHRQSAHHWGKMNSGKQNKLGFCFLDNVRGNRPMLNGCGKYKVWVDAGVPSSRGKCFYPGMHGLENIVSNYPNATIVLSTREALNWVRSVRKYAGGTLMDKWQRNCPDFPNANSTELEWAVFYDGYNDSIRKFSIANPSLTLVEVNLESSLAPSVLKEKVGFRKNCLMHCRPHTGCEKLNDTFPVGIHSATRDTSVHSVDGAN
jgi:hypothetical protein